MHYSHFFFPIYGHKCNLIIKMYTWTVMNISPIQCISVPLSFILVARTDMFFNIQFRLANTLYKLSSCTTNFQPLSFMPVAFNGQSIMMHWLGLKVLDLYKY